MQIILGFLFIYLYKIMKNTETILKLKLIFNFINPIGCCRLSSKVSMQGVVAYCNTKLVYPFQLEQFREISLNKQNIGRQTLTIQVPKTCLW